MKRERDIADTFNSIFRNYHILTPSMNAERGWPDKLIQLDNSRVVAAELKRVFINTRNYFVLDELRQEQSAWLAKWQHHNGKCFVFCGVIRDEALLGYAIITQTVWSDWIQANKVKYYNHKICSVGEVGAWFAGWI